LLLTEQLEWVNVVKREDEMDTNSTQQLVHAISMLEEIKGMSVVQSQHTLRDNVIDTQKVFGQRLVDFLHLTPDGLTPEEKELARQNNRIQAIKSVRTRMGWGLAESKELVEKWMRENGIDPFGGRR
jgi:ribosomal protein L7/L12